MHEQNDSLDRRTGAGALPRGAAHRYGRGRAAAVRWRVRDLRAWQCRRNRRGALSASQPIADLSRPQRAGNGARRDRLRQSAHAPAHDGLHHVDRSRCDQYGDRCRGRARKPPAGTAAARRYLRLARAGSCAATGGGFPRRRHFGQRLLQAGVALLRPHRSSRTVADRAAAGDPCAERSGHVRPGHAGDAAGRADHGLRLAGGFFHACENRVARSAAEPLCSCARRPLRSRTQSVR